MAGALGVRRTGGDAEPAGLWGTVPWHGNRRDVGRAELDWSYRQGFDSIRFSLSRRVCRAALPFRQTQGLIRLQDAPARFEDQAPADDSRKLFSGDGQFAGVINDHIRQSALLSQWPLASFAPVQFVLRPAAMLQHTGQPDGSGTVNQYHPSAKVSPAGFQQDSGIQQDYPAAGLTLGRIHTGLNPSPNFRMHNPFQLPSGRQELGSITKHLLSE